MRNLKIFMVMLIVAVVFFACPTPTPIDYGKVITKGTSSKGLERTITPNPTIEAIMNAVGLSFAQCNQSTGIIEAKVMEAISLNGEFIPDVEINNNVLIDATLLSQITRADIIEVRGGLSNVVLPKIGGVWDAGNDYVNRFDMDDPYFGKTPKSYFTPGTYHSDGFNYYFVNSDILTGGAFVVDDEGYHSAGDPNNFKKHYYDASGVEYTDFEIDRPDAKGLLDDLENNNFYSGSSGYIGYYEPYTPVNLTFVDEPGVGPRLMTTLVITMDIATSFTLRDDRDTPITTDDLFSYHKLNFTFTTTE